MTKPAAIAAQLVDIRNVGTHKVVKLTVHVPEEHALKLTEAFGWPTMVNPVPVAIARLVEPKEGNEEVSEEPRSRPHGGGAKSYAQEAGRLCNDRRFQQFFKPQVFKALVVSHADWATDPADCMTRFVYWYCDVTSRTQIVAGTFAATQWHKLVAEYEAEKVMA